MAPREAQLQAPLSEMPLEPSRTPEAESLQKRQVTLEPSVSSRSGAALHPTPSPHHCLRVAAINSEERVDFLLCTCL